MRDLLKKLYQMSRGQTLAEIVVVIGVVIILTTGLIALTTFSIKNNRMSALKSQAVKFAAEGMEYVRQLRDADWADFQAHGGQIWCLGSGGTWAQTNICLDNLNNYFARTVEFVWDDANKRMAVTVTVDWTEGGNDYETHLDSYFTEWQ